MREQLQIRRATEGDIPTLVQFNCAMALETENKELEPDTILRGTRALFEDEHRGFYLVAQLGQRLIGQLMITYEWSDWRCATFWWIQSVYVEPMQRKKGVLRHLYRYLEGLAQQAGNVCGFRLYVDQHNQQAEEAYRKLGMTPGHYRFWEVDYVFGA
jgi:GNAT superfamily N-acetyltransferase